MSELRVQLSGEHAKLGQVPAGDVARLILEVEKALVKVASAIVGSPKTAGGGRYKQSAVEAARLKLVSIEEGSVVPVLELPEAPTEEGALELDDTPLGEAALNRLLDSANGAATAPDVVAASALLEVLDEVHVGDRYDAVTFRLKKKGQPPRKVRVDAKVRTRLRERIASAPPAPKDETVVGRLYEANFNKRTAKLESPAGGSVDVDFGEEHADEIYRALRHQTRLIGDVVYDPKRNAVRSVKVRSVDQGTQLTLGVSADEFWLARSFDDLAAIQGTGAPVDAEGLYDAEATEDERDAFMAALADLD